MSRRRETEIRKFDGWIESTPTSYPVSFTVHTGAETVKLRGELFAPGPLALVERFAIDNVSPTPPEWVRDGVRANVNGYRAVARYVVPKEDGSARLCCYVQREAKEQR